MKRFRELSFGKRLLVLAGGLIVVNIVGLSLIVTLLISNGTVDDFFEDYGFIFGTREYLGWEEEKKRTIEESTKKIERNPNNAKAYAKRGDAYYWVSEYDKALADLTKAIALNGRDAKSYATRASVYNRMRMEQRALDDLKKAIELNSSEPDYYKERSVLFEELGFLDKALVDIDAAIKYSKKPVRYMIDKAELCLRLGKKDEALKLLTDAIEKKDKYNSSDALRKRIDFYKQEKKYDLAIEDCNKWIESDPDSDWAYETRADIYELAKKKEKAEFDIACAIKIVDEELKKDREDKYSYKKRGDYKFRLGKLAEAQEDWKKAIDLYLNADSLDKYDFDTTLTLANKIDDQTFLKKTYESYMQSLDSQIKFDKHNPKLYFKRGKVFEKIGDLDKAKTDWQKALTCMNKKKMDSVVYKDMIQDLYKKLDKKDELNKITAGEINRLKEKVNNFPTSASTYHDLTVDLDKLERYDEALSAIDKAIELEPRNDHYYWHHAELSMKCKNYDQAVADLNSAIAINDSDKDYFVSLAKALTLSKNHKQAIKEATTVLARDKSLAGAYFWRARAYKSLGDKSKAAKDFRLAKEFKYQEDQD